MAIVGIDHDTVAGGDYVDGVAAFGEARPGVDLSGPVELDEGPSRYFLGCHRVDRA
jgi:hypothetical protein